MKDYKCTKNTKGCANQRGVPGYKLPDCCRAHLMDIMIHMPYILSGINYWMDFGTLLGMTREGKIMEHDDDVDFSVLEGSYDLNALKLRAEECGFWLDDAMPTLLRVRYSKINDLHSDIWVWKNENGILTHRAYAVNQYFDIGLITPVVPQEYFGVEFLVPNDINKFLTVRYDDWKTPRKASEGWTPDMGKIPLKNVRP